jgi:hypothetical protein
MVSARLDLCTRTNTSYLRRGPSLFSSSIVVYIVRESSQVNELLRQEVTVLPVVRYGSSKHDLRYYSSYYTRETIADYQQINEFDMDQSS